MNGKLAVPLKQIEAIKQVSAPSGTAVTPAQGRAIEQTIAARQLDPQAEQIWVCAIMKYLYTNQHIDPFTLTEAQIVELINRNRRAYRRTFGSGQQFDAEMNDEIPDFK